MLTLGIASEFGAKWMFGELFREGVIASGLRLQRGSAFRAALVGAGIARLIPAGGAVTPVAMAWTVHDEAPGASGAALRATVLNYGGLLLATGGGFLWASAWFPETPARPQIAVAGAVGLALGIGFVAGAGQTALAHEAGPEQMALPRTGDASGSGDHQANGAPAHHAGWPGSRGARPDTPRIRHRALTEPDPGRVRSVPTRRRIAGHARRESGSPRPASPALSPSSVSGRRSGRSWCSA